MKQPEAVVIYVISFTWRQNISLLQTEYILLAC